MGARVRGAGPAALDGRTGIGPGAYAGRARLANTFPDRASVQGDAALAGQV